MCWESRLRNPSNHRAPKCPTWSPGPSLRLSHFGAFFTPLASLGNASQPSVALPRRSQLQEPSNFPRYRRVSMRTGTSPRRAAKVRTLFPVCTSHTHTVLSSLPLTSSFPSGAKATDVTPPLCPVKVRTAVPVATYHRRTVLSRLPLAMSVPSGATATVSTPTLCPMRTTGARRSVDSAASSEGDTLTGPKIVVTRATKIPRHPTIHGRRFLYIPRPSLDDG